MYQNSKSGSIKTSSIFGGKRRQRVCYLKSEFIQIVDNKPILVDLHEFLYNQHGL